MLMGLLPVQGLNTAKQYSNVHCLQTFLSNLHERGATTIFSNQQDKSNCFNEIQREFLQFWFTEFHLAFGYC